MYFKRDLEKDLTMVSLQSKRVLTLFILGIVFFHSLALTPIRVHAEVDYEAQAEERKALPIQSNEQEDWPAGPEIGAQSAILLEAHSGAVLYSKNIHDKLYPASVTKILTALIAAEKCDMSEMVTFSNAAVHSINWKEDANMGINVGDQITMEQCLYGLLVGSANEAAYAIAEHICGEGNLDDFAKLMNEKAKELGCNDSHFVTPNGIHDENHYTSARDLSLIAQAFFSNELLQKMSCTKSYHIPKTSTQPRDDMIVWAKSKLLPDKEYAYDGLLGTKTGFTTQARQTLVSCAEGNGMKLICVIMKEESPSQFTDTVELFDYGFKNFVPINIAEKDSKYTIDNRNFFTTDVDFFGSSEPIMQMSKTDYIVLPITAEFDETESELSYDGLKQNELARVNYYFHTVYVGHASIVPIEDTQVSFDFGTKQTINAKPEKEKPIIYINVKTIIAAIILIALLLIVIFMIKALITNTRKYRRRGKIIKRHSIKKQKLDWKHFK